MIMNLLSVSLGRLKLVISSRAINNCFFERVGEKEFFFGGGDKTVYYRKTENNTKLWKFSGNARSSFLYGRLER